MFSEERIKIIRAQAAEMDRTKVVPDEILSWMYEEKLFKLFVSEELGGKLLSLPEALRVFQKASAIEGNVGWLVTIGSGGGMFLPNIDNQIVEELFSSEKAVIAGSGHPNGTAKKVDGGYIINGTWKYCSGALFASFFTANSKLENGEIASFIFMPDQVKITEDWDAFGLKATGSHSITVENAFVPENRKFSIFEQKNQYSSLVHTFPFVPFSQSSFTSVCLGITEHFYEEAKAIATRRMENGSPRFEAVLQMITESEAKFNDNIEKYYEEVEKLWSIHEAGKTITEEDMDEFSDLCKQTVTNAIESTYNLFRKLGMEAIMENSTINKIWRDLFTAGQHSFITP